MDFKPNPKMKSQLACFREGGYVTKREFKREEAREEKKDLAEDKKIAKKAIAQHESAQHKGSEKTEIKLKAGRRVKKEGGVVNKFKKGGAVDAAEKGKPSADKDPIKKVAAKPKKAATPSKAKTKKSEVPGKEVGPSADMEGMTVSALGTPAAAEPSAAMGMMAGPDEYADGGWINEEPDDATAVPGGVATTMAAPGMGRMGKPGRDARMAARQARQAQKMAERQARMAARPQRPMMPERNQIMDMFQGGPSGQTFGPRQPTTAEGMGQASATGGMGNAAPMGAPSDQERNIMRGLQAIGEYCYGGKV